jgi:type I restriction enzyme, R subunit
VAVTVDLLTTGIDVPRIANVVFLRRVKSRILYEQMLGRATRLCPEIEKTVFHTFDAVDLYAALEPYTEMKPVVATPNISFQQLVRELTAVLSAEARQVVLDHLIAKLQRRRQTLKGDDLVRFEGIAAMSPKELSQNLKAGTVEQAAAWFQQHEYVVPVLDGTVAAARPLYVSEHVDRFVGTETGYGKARRPEDYLDGFTAFLRENLNKIPALIVVTQRPRDLTRAQLKDLQLTLDAKGYTEAALQTAWREKTNADIAASIIGYIRKAALGDALVPYDERVDQALKKILSSRSFTTPQRDWLRRIGAQLKKEKILDRKALNEGEAFRSHGGFKHLDKVFDGSLEQVLGDLCEEIWRVAG